MYFFLEANKNQVKKRVERNLHLRHSKRYIYLKFYGVANSLRLLCGKRAKWRQQRSECSRNPAMPTSSKPSYRRELPVR